MIINHFICLESSYLWLSVIFVMGYLPNLFFFLNQILVTNQMLLYICVRLLQKGLLCQTLRFESYN